MISASSAQPATTPSAAQHPSYTRPVLYSQPDITERGRFSKSHLYNLVARGRFPRPLIQGRRFTRWSSADVDSWFADPAAWMDREADRTA